MTMSYWTQFEIDYLKKNWLTIPIRKMALNRTPSSIYYKASLLGLKTSVKVSTLQPLTLNSHEALYWMGFLLADGHFDCKNCALSVTLNEKDKEHLNKLSSLLCCNLHVYKRKLDTIVQLSVTDRINFSNLILKWDIQSNKTKFPPKQLPTFTEEEFYSFIIGFIDGDGSIETHGASGSIVSGLEWNNIMSYIANKLNIPKIELRQATSFSKNSSLRLRLCANVLKFLKQHSIVFNLPVITRKWDRVKLIDYRFKNLTSIQISQIASHENTQSD